MIKKLDMHLWSTVPTILENTSDLQDKVNEIIDVINLRISAPAKFLNEQAALPISDVMPSLTNLNFKQLRKDKGFTLRDVELKVGISNAYLSQLETGKIKNPSYNIVKKLIDLYGNGA